MEAVADADEDAVAVAVLDADALGCAASSSVPSVVSSTSRVASTTHSGGSSVTTCWMGAVTGSAAAGEAPSTMPAMSETLTTDAVQTPSLRRTAATPTTYIPSITN